MHLRLLFKLTIIKQKTEKHILLKYFSALVIEFGVGLFFSRKDDFDRCFRMGRSLIGRGGWRAQASRTHGDGT
jgi:hypothetical protein